MQKSLKCILASGLTTLLTTGAMAEQAKHAEYAKRIFTEKVASWVSDPSIVSAIKQQNTAHADLDIARIEELDTKWRAETRASSKPMIDAVMNNDVSRFLIDRKADAQGLISEVFITDNKGLNVGQSDITSDYWQGDEAKFQKTYAVGPDAIFVDDIELDESSQMMTSQVSMTIKEPETGAAIGTITAGISMEDR